MTKMIRAAISRFVLAATIGFGLLGVQPSFAQAPPEPPPSTVGPEYVIGPGDQLNVFVWRNPELTVVVPVRPDGKISTPLVDDMVAVGKTTSALARDVEKALSRYIRQPQVNIIVTNAVSAMNQVTVTGAVLHPGSMPYREGLKVLDAVLAVGGLTQFAAGNRARIVRGGSDKQENINLKLTRLLQKGDLTQNHMLKPGDVIVVPESFF